MEGLQPSDRFRAIIASRRQLVEAKTGSTAYNLIHLRVEQDWFALCKIWSNPEAGRDNCMNNTDTVGEQLQKHGFEEEVGVPCRLLLLLPHIRRVQRTHDRCGSFKLLLRFTFVGRLGCRCPWLWSHLSQTRFLRHYIPRWNPSSITSIVWYLAASLCSKGRS